MPENRQGLLYHITPHWGWSSSGSCETGVCFLPPKADRFFFYFILCKLEKEKSHLHCGRCIVYLCMQGEPHINVFLMCLGHVQSHRGGKGTGLAGYWAHLPAFALTEPAFLEYAFWNFEQTNFLCPRELILVTIPFQKKFSNMGELIARHFLASILPHFSLASRVSLWDQTPTQNWAGKSKPKR